MTDPTAAAARNVVLFLCTGNYYRSRFAEILFNHLARQRGLAWRAESRGLDLKIGNNVGPLSQHTRDACAARDVPLPNSLRMPMPTCETDLSSATIVIAVKEAEHRPRIAAQFPQWCDRVRYWHVHDLDAADPADGTAELEANVRKLLDELAETPRGLER